MTEIVAVHSFRGGTGKTNLTANLAAQLALPGRRVAIVDTDVQTPGIHALFGLDDATITHALNGYLWGACPILRAAHDVTSSLGPTAAPGARLHLVPSSIKAGDLARLSRESYDLGYLNDGLYELADGLGLDYLLLDTHPGLREQTLVSITVAHVLLVVLRPDQQDFQGAAVTLEVARTLEIPRTLLVLNIVPSGSAFAALARDVAHTYHTPVAAVLPLTEDLARLASSALLSLQAPEHPWSQGLRAIVQALEAGEAEASGN